VRKRLDDVLVVEGQGGLVRTEQIGPADPEVNNTVLFSVVEGAVEILHESPLRYRLQEDATEDLSRFEFTPEKGSLTYAQFGGSPALIARARQIIETQFKHKVELDKIGARPVRGVLMSGPPGTGKTHLARIIAAEADASYFIVSGPSIVSKYVGDTEDVLRRIFRAAESKERAIVFFDEIDSIAGERTAGSHESSDRLVAQLLTEMDGFTAGAGNVIVLAATNRPDIIDPALRRPGRFDWEITFELPSALDRLAILEVDAGRLATRGELPLEEIAEASSGWSGAKLASIWTEAALLAAADSRGAIDAEDLLEGFSVVARDQSAKEQK
jgi:transitional endoplasmic reticulum ATPase